MFGYVHEKEDNATTFAPFNGNIVNQCHSACAWGGGMPFFNNEQFSEELRLSGKAVDNRLTWSLGGYMGEQRPAGPYENETTSVGILERVGYLYAKTTSRAVYGSAEFAVTDKFKINGGLRSTTDEIQSKQNTYLSFIPGGQTALFNRLTTAGYLLGLPGTGAPSNTLGVGGTALPQGVSAAVANAMVAANFAPIPYGQCVTYGVGMFLNGAAGTPCASANATFNATTWQIGASYKTDSGQLLYAKGGKGYRPGGVNGTAPAGAVPSYFPETDVSLEVGIKADWNFNGVFLRTNLAAYTDRYKAIQKNVVLPGNGPLSLVQNVDDARVKGIELEATLIPLEGLTLGGTFAYTDAKFDFVNTSGFT